MKRIPKRTLKLPPTDSLETLLSKCQQAFQQNDFSATRVHCERILQIENEHPLALLISARIDYLTDRALEAKNTLLRMSKRYPNSLEVWNDLAVVLIGLREYQMAAEQLTVALTNTGYPVLLLEKFCESNLAIQQAEPVLKILQTHHQQVESSQRLRLYQAEAFRWLGQYQAAADILDAEIAIAPNDESLYKRLIAVWREAAIPSQLQTTLTRWLAISPNNPIALHLLGALDDSASDNEAARASDEYIQGVFDQFADTFDESLASLDYQAPHHVEQLIRQRINRGELSGSGLKILDGGCGTGLCGPFLKPLSSALVGVDLSEGMLQHAQKRRLYDSLHQAELAHFLGTVAAEQSAGAFDLIVICDTLNYFGDLREVLTNTLAALKQSGILVFTIETLQADVEREFVLSMHGRYAHSPDCILRLMQSIGYQEVTQRAFVLRKQAGVPVAGTLICGRKTH
jgi:predicted TPR repeat methyltransferase